MTKFAPLNMDLIDKIEKDKVPCHVAIIMDGNGRWAKKNFLKRTMGHKYGVRAVRKVVESCVRLGVKHLTLYAFSTENWNRPKYEIEALMNLLVSSLKKELPTFLKNGVSLNSIGDIESLPLKCQKELNECIDKTSQENKLQLNLALSYSSKREILNAVNEIIADNEKTKRHKQIDEKIFNSYLQTKGIPEPELMIRTSGEYRISNFLLWQMAYTEFYFTDVLWPDFDENELYKAIHEYQKRERRFGKTSEQVS